MAKRYRIGYTQQTPGLPMSVPMGGIAQFPQQNPFQNLFYQSQQPQIQYVDVYEEEVPIYRQPATIVEPVETYSPRPRIRARSSNQNVNTRNDDMSPQNQDTARYQNSGGGFQGNGGNYQRNGGGNYQGNSGGYQRNSGGYQSNGGNRGGRNNSQNNNYGNRGRSNDNQGRGRFQGSNRDGRGSNRGRNGNRGRNYNTANTSRWNNNGWNNDNNQWGTNHDRNNNQQNQERRQGNDSRYRPTQRTEQDQHQTMLRLYGALTVDDSIKVRYAATVMDPRHVTVQDAPQTRLDEVHPHSLPNLENVVITIELGTANTEQFTLNIDQMKLWFRDKTVRPCYTMVRPNVLYLCPEVTSLTAEAQERRSNNVISNFHTAAQVFLNCNVIVPQSSGWENTDFQTAKLVVAGQMINQKWGLSRHENARIQRDEEQQRRSQQRDFDRRENERQQNEFNDQDAIGIPIFGPMDDAWDFSRSTGATTQSRNGNNPRSQAQPNTQGNQNEDHGWPRPIDLTQEEPNSGQRKRQNSQNTNQERDRNQQNMATANETPTQVILRLQKQLAEMKEPNGKKPNENTTNIDNREPIPANADRQDQPIQNSTPFGGPQPGILMQKSNDLKQSEKPKGPQDNGAVSQNNKNDAPAVVQPVEPDTNFINEQYKPNEMKMVLAENQRKNLQSILNDGNKVSTPDERDQPQQSEYQDPANEVEAQKKSESQDETSQGPPSQDTSYQSRQSLPKRLRRFFFGF